MEVSAKNKTDHDIHLNPAFEWTVNGEEAYGVLVMNPKPGETTETSIIFTDAKGKTLPYEAITDAAGVIQVQDENFNILDNFDFAYSS